MSNVLSLFVLQNKDIEFSESLNKQNHLLCKSTNKEDIVSRDKPLLECHSKRNAFFLFNMHTSQSNVSYSHYLTLPWGGVQISRFKTRNFVIKIKVLEPIYVKFVQDISLSEAALLAFISIARYIICRI